MNNILFFLKIPPPFTGATLMNKRIVESNFINEKYRIIHILFSYQNNTSDFGKIRMENIRVLLLNVVKLIYNIIKYRPKFIYFQISLTGISFIRDSFYVIMMKILRQNILFHFRIKGFSKIISKQSLALYYYKLIFRNSNIIVLSELLKEEVIQTIGIQPYVVNNGYPVLTNEIKRNFDGKFCFLFLSNLFKSKGIIEYIEIMNLMKLKNINFEAFIAGAEGDIYYSDIKRILENYSLLDRVTVYHYLTGEKKNEVLKKSNLFIYPTHNDAFPGVIIDAMQFSIPVISTNQGSIPLIIANGETGYIVEKNEPNYYLEKIEFFIKDPIKLIEFGKKARDKYLREYTFNKFEKNMDKVFNKMIFADR